LLALVLVSVSVPSVRGIGCAAEDLGRVCSCSKNLQECGLTSSITGVVSVLNGVPICDLPGRGFCEREKKLFFFFFFFPLLFY
jgi:hypothetical protein